MPLTRLFKLAFDELAVVAAYQGFVAVQVVAARIADVKTDEGWVVELLGNPVEPVRKTGRKQVYCLEFHSGHSGDKRMRPIGGAGHMGIMKSQRLDPVQNRSRTHAAGFKRFQR